MKEFEIIEESFNEILLKDSHVEHIATGFGFVEGPVSKN